MRGISGSLSGHGGGETLLAALALFIETTAQHEKKGVAAPLLLWLILIKTALSPLLTCIVAWRLAMASQANSL